MDETRRVNLDPTTGKARIEVVSQEPSKTYIDEDKLLRKKEYLEKAISDFQAELEQVNLDLEVINNEKNVEK